MSYPRDRLLWDRMYRLWLLSRAKTSERLRNAVQLGLFEDAKPQATQEPLL